MRSLRMEYRTCNSNARNSFSGAIDGRPQSAYSWSKDRESPFNARSTIGRIVRNG